VAPPLRLIRIRRAARSGTRGWLVADGAALPVVLGRTGIRAGKREGDGATPRGVFHPLRLWWRRDRAKRPATSLPTRAIAPFDAWCEDPADRRYNQPVRVAPDAKGDRLARDDHLYDYIVEIDHNTRPRVSGRGSAVFLHLARDNFGPTAGCVGLRRGDMLRLLERLTRRTRIVVE
jgi:L,D-peptidoglycan transpeptidase YkuD (ErfK/YbiS/YcfS/YnhG family)